MAELISLLIRILSLVTLIVVGGFSGAADIMAAPLPDTIEKVKASIVAVGTVQQTRRPPASFLGTGFIVGDGSLVMTNEHVVAKSLDTANREAWAVFVGTEGQVRRAKKIAKDVKHDLALLKISGEPLPALSFGDSERVREGELYAFTGFPIGPVLGLHPVTHEGIVSAITPIAIPLPASKELNALIIDRLRHPFDVFQLDAIAYPGNSGSPLYIPSTGKVIGIVNAVFVKESKESILQKPSGISYAIPAKYARALLKKIGGQGR